MISSYTYQIKGEGSHFATGKVNASTLTNEINLNVGIQTPLDFINTDVANNTCTLCFLSELSDIEKVELDKIIEQHQGVDVFIPESLSQNTVLNQSYKTFIDMVNAKGMLLQADKQDMATTLGYGYYLFAFDAGIKYHTLIYLEKDITDYETKYAPTSNKPLDMREAGTGILKVKPRLVEGTLYYIFCYVTMNSTVLDHDSENALTVTVAPVPNTDFVTTTVSFKPTYNYYIAGGRALPLSDTIDTSIALKVIGAPSIPAAYGGNIVLVNNKKFMLVHDGMSITAPPKFMKYYQTNPYANEIVFRFIHSKTSDASFELGLETYTA